MDRESGRLTEALELAERKSGFTRQADLGPWTQLADEVQWLQIFSAMGHAELVLTEIPRLHGRMATLLAMPVHNEMVTPWNAREVLLATGRDAAIRLGQWDEALSLSANVVASARGRIAPVTSVARTRFSDYGPLLGLGRSGEALCLLQDCLRAFQDASDIAMIGKSLNALAAVDDRRGRGEAAIQLERDALRYMYLVGSVSDITVSYYNLGTYLASQARQPASAVASYITAALVRSMIGISADDPGGAQRPLHAAAGLLREPGTAVAAPTTVADLGRQLGDVSGTDLLGLIARLSPDQSAANERLRETVAAAQQFATVIQMPEERSPEIVIAPEQIVAYITGTKARSAAIPREDARIITAIGGEVPPGSAKLER
jgi:hypothetical protein